MFDSGDIMEVPTARLCRGAAAGLFISPGVGIHPTRVVDFHEIIIVRSGLLGMQENGRKFDVSAGQALHLFPGRRHGGTLGYKKGLSFYWLHFMLPDKKTSQPALRIPQLVTLPRPERAQELMHRYLSDIEEGLDDEYSRSLLVMLILHEISTAAGAKMASDTRGMHVADRAMEYIASNFTRPISTADIAEKLGYNGDYLARIFKDRYNIAPVAAVNSRRIAMARRLLVGSAKNLNEIAVECGFASSAYMRKVFEKHTGVKPSAYRKEFSRVHFNTH